jgi:hypothetical protein
MACMHRRPAYTACIAFVYGTKSFAMHLTPCIAFVCGTKSLGTHHERRHWRGSHESLLKDGARWVTVQGEGGEGGGAGRVGVSEAAGRERRGAEGQLPSWLVCTRDHHTLHA